MEKQRTLKEMEADLDERATLRWNYFKECKDKEGNTIITAEQLELASQDTDEAISSCHVFDMHWEMIEQFCENVRTIRDLINKQKEG